MIFTKEEIEELRKGGRIIVGNSIYMMCGKCFRAVKLNKFIFGALHICDES